MLLELAKKSNFLQNFVIQCMTSLHPMIMHNLGKIEMVKKALFHCELEQIPGGYFEFGVYEGSTLLAAAQIDRKMRSKITRSFYGFDSFDEGFKYFDDKDKHPFFKEGDFKSSLYKVQKRLKKFKNVHLIPGYFEESLSRLDDTVIQKNETCAVVFIDCDLMHPAKLALDFIAPRLQPGSIVILDDFFAYKGSDDLGTAGAWRRFLEEHPTIEARQYTTYGCGGVAFVIMRT